MTEKACVIVSTIIAVLHFSGTFPFNLDMTFTATQTVAETMSAQPQGSKNDTMAESEKQLIALQETL